MDGYILKRSSVVECEGWNCSVVNLTKILLNRTDEYVDTELPKGYSLPHIILTSFLISVIMFVVVFGNLLVVIAIFTDKNLKTTQNWFIASLAVADFLLGLVIMPFSLANEMMGYWYFGRVWCDLWKAIDVLLCTASILSICLISLDRYWSITRAIQYSRQRTGKRAALMIASVWFLSAIICVPPLIGWKNPLPVSDYPLCLLSDEIGYVLYSTMGSFYIPCVIMVFVYFKIYLAARRLARKSVKGKHIRMQMKVEIKEELTTDYQAPKTQCTLLKGSFNSKQQSDTKQLCDDIKAKPESVNEYSSDSIQDSQSPTEVEHRNNVMNGHKSPIPSNNCIINNTDKLDSDTLKVSEMKSSIHRLPSTDSNDSKVETNHNEKNSKTDKTGSGAFIKNIGCRLSKKKHRANGNKNSKGWRTASLREHERHKKKLAKARERRATIVLGLVMAAFILCWFPFFTLYIITSFCNCIEEVVFTVVFWAGYCNSALNPIIYTVFNREFRQAFHKIICRKAIRWSL